VEPSVHEHARTLVFRRRAGSEIVAIALHFGGGTVRVAASLPAGRWDVLDSGSQDFGGPGATVPASVESDGEIDLELGPWAAVVLRRDT
jgi:hypothetical protein